MRRPVHKVRLLVPGSLSLKRRTGRAASRNKISPAQLLLKKIILPELQGVQLFVGAVGVHQLLVGSPFHNTPVYDYSDFVRVADGGETMGYHQGGAAPAQFVQGLLNQHFGGIVQGTGGLVQNQNGGIFQEYPGDAKALLLAAGELDAPFADFRVVALFQGHDVIVDIGPADCLIDFFLGGVRASVEDVFPDGAHEEEHVLLYDADIAADGFHGQAADVLAVDKDGAVAFLDFVEIGQQMAQGGFSAAGRANQCQFAAFFQAQVDVVEHLLGGIIGIGDVLKFNDALHIGEFLCVRGVGFRRFVHDFHKPLEAADAVLELFHKADEGVHRIDEQVHGDDKGGIISEGYPAVIQEQASCNEDEHIEDIRHKGSGRVELGHGPVSPAGGIHKLPVALPEFLHLPGAVGIGLGDADAGDAALHGGIDGGVALAAIVKGTAHGPAEVQGDHHQNRNTGKDNQGQDGIDQKQVGKGQQDHHRADEQVFRAVVGQFADLEQITGDAVMMRPVSWLS